MEFILIIQQKTYLDYLYDNDELQESKNLKVIRGDLYYQILYYKKYLHIDNYFWCLWFKLIL